MGQNGGLPLTLTVALTTGQHCRAAYDRKTANIIVKQAAQLSQRDRATV